MSSVPRISVLIPVYNGEAYLTEAIDSILAQTETDFECLVVDDGSTDGSKVLLSAYAARDKRIRLFDRGHEGLVPALNFGIGIARAPYIARMDADDIAHPERLSRQAGALDANPGIAVLGSAVECIDEKGRPLRTFHPPMDHETLDRLHITTGTPQLWHPSAMLRTDVLRSVGGYSADYPYTEDFDLWLRIGEVGDLANLPEILLSYRLHLQSVSVTKREIQNDSAHKALAAARVRRGLTLGDMPTASDVVPTEITVIRKWAYWALKAGHLASARHYAWESFRRAPLDPLSLRLGLAVMKSIFRT